MTVRAALLTAPAASGKGLFVRVDELVDASQLTDRHVPSITVCDLPPERYLWIPDERTRPGDGSLMNEYGGAFWDLPWMREMAKHRAKAEDVHAEAGLLPPVFRGDQITFLRSYLAERGLLEEKA